MTGYRESGCESQIMWVSSISPSCHQQLKLVTNIWFRHFLTIDFKSKFRESTVRVYAETYSPKRTRVSISKIFLRKIKKNASVFLLLIFVDFVYIIKRSDFRRFFFHFFIFFRNLKNDFQSTGLPHTVWDYQFRGDSLVLPLVVYLAIVTFSLGSLLAKFTWQLCYRTLRGQG